MFHARVDNTDSVINNATCRILRKRSAVRNVLERWPRTIVSYPQEVWWSVLFLWQNNALALMSKREEMFVEILH